MNHPAVDNYLEELLAPVAQAAGPATDAANEPDANTAPTVAGPVPAPVPAAAPAAAPAPAAASTRADRLQERAELRPAGEDSRPRVVSASARWLRARLGADSYAFQLLKVQEVVRVSPVVAMRGAAVHVLGVMNLRGRIVPVTDLALWLGTGRVEADEQSRIIVLEHRDELIGVLVSALDDVTSIGEDDIEQPFQATSAGAVLGVSRSDGTPTVLLDATALFR